MSLSVYSCKLFPAATDISRRDRNADTTTAPTTSGPSPSSASPFLVLQQGKDGKDGRDGVNGRDGRDGLPGRTGEKGDPGVQGPQGPTGPQGKTYHELHCRETLQNMQSILLLILLILNNQVPQVPVWVVQCTPGGGGQCVQTSQEHNSCMLEELLEAGGTIREGEPTASAYLMTQVTYSTHLGNKLIEIIYMVQSTTVQMDHS